MTLPRRMFQLGRHQKKRWLISLGLGSLLMALLLWEAGQSPSISVKSSPYVEEWASEFDAAGSIDVWQRSSTQTLRNPDRWEGRAATQQIQKVRQCLTGNGSGAIALCLGQAVPQWKSHPRKLHSFLEALRYHERQVGRQGDVGVVLDQLAKLMPESRDSMETYQYWLAIQRHRWDPMSHRLGKAVHRFRPRYLGLLLQADQTARQGLRSSSMALYEAASVSFLDAMLEKMRLDESISIETYNQSQDLKDLARLYMQFGWWPEAERILYHLAEQEPSDMGLLALLQQLRQRQTRWQAG